MNKPKNKQKKNKDWEVKKLGEICDFQNGFAFKSKLFSEDGLPILRISNIQKDKISYKRLAYFKKESYEIDFKKYEVNKGDLVIAMSGATTGKLAISDADEIFYLNQRVGKFKPRENLFRDFLYYFLTTKIEDNLKISQGTAQPNLSTEQIKNFEIPIPPLTEQKRIVKILDQVFADIKKARENAEKNLENAKKLFESYLEKIFEGGDDWEEKKLIDICFEITDGSHFSPKSSDSGTYPYITVRDIDNGIINFNNCKFIEKKDYKLLLKNGCKPNEGDLLYSKDGTVGKVSLINFKKDFVVLSSLAIIRPKLEVLNSCLLKYILENPSFLKRATGLKTGAAIRRIILRNLKKIMIKFPKSLQKQKEIVKKLDELSESVGEYEAILRSKIAGLDELKKSVLEKAFNGEL